MQWDDLRVFLTLARQKKLNLAAKQLKIDETTVSRRIKRLESSLGQTLFERLRSGHKLTRHGEELLQKVEILEQDVGEIRVERGTSGYDPSGTIRVSVAEGFGAAIVAPILGEFCNQYPDIEIDLVSGSGFLSLSRREADIAIGLSRSKSNSIISEKLVSYSLSLYAAPSYLERSEAINSLDCLSEHRLIDYVDDLIYSDELRYFEEVIKTTQPTLRTSSIMAQLRMVEAGAGLAILPNFIATDKLVPIFQNEIRLNRQFWFSCHQSAAKLEKVKVFKRFAFSALALRLKGLE